MKVAVIENHETAPAGTFGTWLRDVRGATLATIPGPQAAARAGEIAAADLVVTLGSPAAAYDHDPWIAAQRSLLTQLVADGHAVIGICFGAQLLAASLGGAVTPLGDARRRLGWVANDEVASPVWAGPWLRWNNDHFTAPPEAHVLARSEGTIQAFRRRRALGVQFHPEAVPDALALWIEHTPRDHLNADPATLHADLVARLAAGTAARDAVFAEMLRVTADA